MLISDLLNTYNSKICTFKFELIKFIMYDNTRAH